MKRNLFLICLIFTILCSVFFYKKFYTNKKSYTVLSIPLNASQWHDKGKEFAHRGNYNKALDAFNKSIEIDPLNADFWKSKGLLIYHFDKSPEDAISAFNRVIELLPNETLYRERAISLYKAKYYNKSLKLIDKAIGEKIDNSYLYYVKAECLAGINKPKKSIKYLNKAIKLNSDDSKYWNRRGELLTSVKQYNNSIKDFDKAINIDPQNYIYWFNKGYSLSKLSKIEEANKSFRKSINIKPTYGAWFNIGLLYDLKKDVENSLEAYSKSLELNYNSSDAWEKKRELFKKTGVL